MKLPFKNSIHKAKEFSEFSDIKNSVLGKTDLRKLEESDLSEDEFIDLNFQIEFNNLVLPLFIFIGTFQMWAYTFVEYALFGFHPMWLLIRIAYLPYIVIICKVWKMLWRNHPVLYLIPLIACYLYI